MVCFQLFKRYFIISNKFGGLSVIKSIRQKTVSEIIINKSRFVCTLYPCNNISSIHQILETHKIEYPNANHHCYAYIIDHYEKANDDGEPSGTAGLPILNVLQKNQLQSIVAIVTRYFGGIKLGSGGLVRAYTTSCAKTIKEASIVVKHEVPLYLLSFDYTYIGQIDYLLKQRNVEIIKKDFEENVKYQCYIIDDCIFSKIQDITSSQYQKKFIKKEYIEISEAEDDKSN